MLMLLFLSWIWYFEYHTVVYNSCLIKYRKIKTLAQIISMSHKSILAILWGCMCVIAKTWYIILCQWFNKTVTKRDKHTYELSFVVNGVLYKSLIKIKRGPKCLIQAIDQDDVDITEVVQSWAGPMEDFGKHDLTPVFFGKEEITVSLSSGEDKVFKTCDVIKI